MTIKQLSVFLENRPGHLSRVCETLAEAGINIVTMTLADTTEYGILRMIVHDWQRASEVLDAAGFTVNRTDVLAIEVADEPGGLEKVLKVIEADGLGIDYMYAFACSEGDHALIVMRCAELERAITALDRAGIGMLGPDQLK